MSGEFIANFIQDCISNGFNKPSEMRLVAEEEMLEIDNEIRKIDALKIKQVNLRAVIYNLGGSNSKSKKIDFSLPKRNLDESHKLHLNKVIEIIENNITGIETGKIVDIASEDLKLSLENRSRIYGAIKWLGARRILDRDENRLVIIGKNWEERVVY